jgi:hypothetical protein
MLINSLPILPVTTLNSEIQPARVEPVPPANQSDSNQPNQTLRAVIESKEADKLLLRTRSRQSMVQQQNTLYENPRSRKALSAYQSLEQDEERDYVSTLLGVDEYA